MIKALQAMYQSVKACVRYKNVSSSFFNIHSGVKQGGPLSPVLFILFINDLLVSTSVDDTAVLTVNQINLASGKLFPWYLCLMYVYAFGEKHFCMFNANKVFVLYCIVI